jgi:hypothetical protein
MSAGKLKIIFLNFLMYFFEYIALEKTSDVTFTQHASEIIINEGLHLGQFKIGLIYTYCLVIKFE